MLKKIIGAALLLTASLAQTAMAADQAPSVASFFAEPVCYLETKDSEYFDPQGNILKDKLLVELVFLPHVQALLGVFAYLPAEVDQTTGTLDAFSYELMAGDEEKYLIKTMFHYNVEGEFGISDQFFIATKDKIFISTGERKQNPYDNTYTYVNQDELDYSRSIPRIDCATPLSF